MSTAIRSSSSLASGWRAKGIQLESDIGGEKRSCRRGSPERARPRSGGSDSSCG
ncbi:hypothetical protein [Lysobacter gummosus]|uniref:hypothetical protein n=1 Tax=Lysobacter gummosus TaxID=262324 RepID=UPI003624AF8A